MWGQGKITVHLVSPNVPAGRFLSGKQLHAGQIAHQGNDFGAGLVRLFAMGFNRGNDELMNVGSLPLWMSLGCQQADFCIAPCPEAKAVKPAIRLLVLFQTAIAAINTERRFVCFETAPSFYAAASERIRAAQAVKSSGEKGV